jgi:dihydrofolate synthase/folylpolyglutamate synthase
MAERAVAAGVIEVGLGGRWDATNLIDSSVATLTHIDVDHAGLLGSTPLENAQEKVDIIKQGAAVISDSQASDVAELVISKARQRGARLALLGRDFHVRSDETAVGGRVVSIHTSRGRYEDLYLPLHGSHQATNTALAVAAAEEFLDRPLDNAALVAALASVSSPGRMEVVGHRPLVVLDGAHNPHASAALVRSLQQDFRRRQITMVIAFSKDKDIDGMLSHLIPAADRVIFSSFNNPRAADPAALATRPAAATKDAKVVESLTEATDLALAMSSEEDMVVVTGSLYAVGEAREHLLGPP